MNYEKIQKFTTSPSVTFERADVKALIAALTFIFTNATKFQVEQEVLQMELEQLGLPSDICKSICRLYRTSWQELYNVMAARTLKIGGLKSVDWRVDYIFASRTASSLEDTTAMISLDYSSPVDGETGIQFESSSRNLMMLLHELQIARKTMETTLSN